MDLFSIRAIFKVYEVGRVREVSLPLFEHIALQRFNALLYLEHVGCLQSNTDGIGQRHKLVEKFLGEITGQKRL